MDNAALEKLLAAGDGVSVVGEADEEMAEVDSVQGGLALEAPRAGDSLGDDRGRVDQLLR